MALDTESILCVHPLPWALCRCGSTSPAPRSGMRDERRRHYPLYRDPASRARPKPTLGAHVSGRMAG